MTYRIIEDFDVARVLVNSATFIDIIPEHIIVHGDSESCLDIDIDAAAESRRRRWTRLQSATASTSLGLVPSS